MIKAIDTQYKGYLFRSRLEARWAVFFDAIGLRWEYEPEGFHTAAGMYLPDFRVWTPQGNPIWYEVKPAHILDDGKISALESALMAENYETPDFDFFHPEPSIRCALLSGDPVEHLERNKVEICPRCGLIDVPAYGLCDGHVETGIGCEPCDYETPSGGYHPYEPGVMGVAVTPHKGFIKARDCDLSMLKAKAKIARAARFEHGERK